MGTTGVKNFKNDSSLIFSEMTIYQLFNTLKSIKQILFPIFAKSTHWIREIEKKNILKNKK